MNNELLVLEQCEHMNITRAIELSEDDQYYYVIMELVSGGDLLKRMQEIKRFSEQKAAKVVE